MDTNTINQTQKRLLQKGLGEKIQTLRMEKGLTPGELAERLKIEPAVLDQYEKGRAIPTPEVFRRTLSVFSL